MGWLCFFTYLRYRAEWSMPLEREQRIAPRQHDMGANWLNVQRNGDAIAAVV